MRPFKRIMEETAFSLLTHFHFPKNNFRPTPQEFTLRRLLGSIHEFTPDWFANKNIEDGD
jgi:hypothetical protein